MQLCWRIGAVLAMVASVAATESASAEGDTANGAKVFKKCMACHRIGPEAKNLVGPQLNGVVGRKAATVPDYPYSSAMKDSGLIWDEATLAEYLRSPRALVSKTRMIFVGIRKDGEIADLIAYLKTFDAKGNPAAP